MALTDFDLQDFERQLPKDAAIAFVGNLEAFDQRGKLGSRYTIRVNGNTTATGEFITAPPKPPQWKGTRIVAYKWTTGAGNQGNWLFETAESAEQRRILGQILPNIQRAGPIAQRLQEALNKATRNNLVAKSAGVTERGAQGSYQLSAPYKGQTNINAFSASRNNSGESVLLLDTDGQWVALGNDSDAGQQTRRDIERSGEQPQPGITGKVGYLFFTLVATKASGDPLSWSRKWQCWVGGLTPNMILVKEWPWDNAQGASKPWLEVEPYAVLDVRDDAFYVSMCYIYQGGEYGFSVIKGDPNKDGKADGTLSPDVQILWEKKFSEFTPNAGTLASINGPWRPHGFGYFTAARTDESNGIYYGYGLDQNQGQSQPTIKTFSVPYGTNIRQIVPVGWDLTDPIYNTYEGISFNEEFNSYWLIRIGSDGRSSMIEHEKMTLISPYFGGKGQTWWRYNNNYLIYNSLSGSDPADSFQERDPLYVVGNDSEWFNNIPGQIWNQQSGDVYQDFVALIDWMGQPNGLAYKTETASLVDYSSVYLFDYWLYFPVFGDTWKMFDFVFPELRPSDAALRTATDDWWGKGTTETVQSRADADAAAQQNIFHTDKEITVFLRAPDLNSQYGQNLSVPVFRAKQIMDIVNGSTYRLERLKFVNASFGANGYQ